MGGSGQTPFVAWGSATGAFLDAGDLTRAASFTEAA